MSITVAAFSGSLRKDSYTTKLVKAFQQLAPVDVSVAIISIGTRHLLTKIMIGDREWINKIG